MSHLILQVFVYGPDQRRAEIELRPQIPAGIRGNIEQLHSWSQALVLALGFDMKHTQEWGCEMCSKPARETSYDVKSWIHLPEPRVVVYVHQLCEAGSNHCNKVIEAQTRMMAEMTGTPFSGASRRLPKPLGIEYPLSSSCCKCQKDETAVVGHGMYRCGGCKLVRYCSAVCQKDDWGRHKKICKMVDSVKWVGWD